MEKPMATQLIATYGLSRSPILAAFQKIPKNLGKAREHNKTKGERRGGGWGARRLLPVLVLVEHSGNFLVEVGAGANEEENDDQETLKVEEG